MVRGLILVSRVAIIGSFTLLAAFSCSARGKKLEATVSLLLTDGEGKGHRNTKVETFENTLTKSDFARTFHEAQEPCYGDVVAKKVPYGAYELTASGGGFPAIHMRVRIA